MYRDLPAFDTVVTLHKEQPDELDRIRTELTDPILENTTGDCLHRLQGSQVGIDMELRRARTPEARFVKISSMMHEAFAELNHVLHHPEQPGAADVNREARIIPFTKPRDRSLDH